MCYTTNNEYNPIPEENIKNVKNNENIVLNINHHNNYIHFENDAEHRSSEQLGNRKKRIKKKRN